MSFPRTLRFHRNGLRGRDVHLAMLAPSCLVSLGVDIIPREIGLISHWTLTWWHPNFPFPQPTATISHHLFSSRCPSSAAAVTNLSRAHQIFSGTPQSSPVAAPKISRRPHLVRNHRRARLFPCVSLEMHFPRERLFPYGMACNRRAHLSHRRGP